MDINRMSDEELVQEIAGRCVTNGAAKSLVKFIRQCVKDSQNELVEALSRIKKFKGNMDCEKVYEIIDEALASVEEAGLEYGLSRRKVDSEKGEK